MQRRIIAFHLIFGTYAHWLPNDDRGSGSDYVRNKLLLAFGNATKVETRTSVAHRPYDRQKRKEAETVLKYPPVRFTSQQIAVAGEGFRHAGIESGYRIFACAVMPTHTHLVIAWHENKAEQIIGHLKGRATKHLQDAGFIFPASPWQRKGWTVYLFTDNEVCAAVRYVERNPEMDGLAPQHWDFVVPYNRNDI